MKVQIDSCEPVKKDHWLITVSSYNILGQLNHNSYTEMYVGETSSEAKLKALKYYAKNKLDVVKSNKNDIESNHNDIYGCKYTDMLIQWYTTDYFYIKSLNPLKFSKPIRSYEEICCLASLDHIDKVVYKWNKEESCYELQI
jgi:hypothetical protein